MCADITVQCMFTQACLVLGSNQESSTMKWCTGMLSCTRGKVWSLECYSVQWNTNQVRRQGGAWFSSHAIELFPMKACNLVLIESAPIQSKGLSEAKDCMQDSWQLSVVQALALQNRQYVIAHRVLLSCWVWQCLCAAFHAPYLSLTGNPKCPRLGGHGRKWWNYWLCLDTGHWPLL